MWWWTPGVLYIERSRFQNSHSWPEWSIVATCGMISDLEYQMPASLILPLYNTQFGHKRPRIWPFFRKEKSLNV